MIFRLELAFEKTYGQIRPSQMTSDIKGVIKINLTDHISALEHWIFKF